MLPPIFLTKGKNLYTFWGKFTKIEFKKKQSDRPQLFFIFWGAKKHKLQNGV